MATQSPFSLLQGILQSVNFPLAPPSWAVDETHRRLVLLLNHVLMQEPQARERLARQKGRVIRLQWRTMTFKAVLTPAGLLDVALPEAQPDLALLITDESPLTIAQELLEGVKPAVRIEGDVQLAAEVSWLIDHVRWDVEEDLARLMGDASAHLLMQAVGAMAQAVRRFVGHSSQRDADGPLA